MQTPVQLVLREAKLWLNPVKPISVEFTYYCWNFAWLNSGFLRLSVTRTLVRLKCGLVLTVSLAKSRLTFWKERKKKNTKNTGFGVKSALMTRKEKEEFSGRSFLFFNFFQRGVYSSLLKIMKTWTGHVSCFSIWFYRHVEYTNPPDSPDCGLVSQSSPCLWPFV